MSKIIKFAFLIIGAVLVAVIVRQGILLVTRPSTQAVRTAKVRVSGADLPQGLLLRDEDLRWKDVPVNSVPSGAVVSGTSGSIDLKGALLRHPVIAGTVLITDDVILPNAPGFLAATLKPNMRAVSVAVDDVSGNAGLIQPGDYVDLLLTQQLGDRGMGPAHSVVSETVVQHARVLASGSEIIRPKSGDGNLESRQTARTVTLEVTPHMGEVIAVAARLGSLSLALHSFATTSRAGRDAPTSTDIDAQSLPAPVWSGEISRALVDPPPVSVAKLTAMPTIAHSVTIYRGSTRSEAMPGDSIGAMGSGMPPLPPSTIAR